MTGLHFWKRGVIGATNIGTFKEIAGKKKQKHNVPVPGAFKPVEDVCAPGVVDLVKWVRIGLLDGHRIA